MMQRGNHSQQIWTESAWIQFADRLRDQALKLDDGQLSGLLFRGCRRVMRTYTTSFFIVSRFLPPAKRARVEAIYAAVRYPDEVVDSFPLSPEEREQRLAVWERGYEIALRSKGLRDSLQQGVSVFLAPFVEVVKEHRIPDEYYRSFLRAMRLDIRPRPFSTVNDLIESYIYGSAIVVGYFLTYVYGSSQPERFNEALQAARDLGIALQLTNFLRDVAEDQRRGRVYLPQDVLGAEGIRQVNVEDPAQHEALSRVIRTMAGIAADCYERSRQHLDAFAEDCRIAIDSCIRVYGRLNERIRESKRGLHHRESVPLLEKMSVLPMSKYWKIPLAYILP